MRPVLHQESYRRFCHHIHSGLPLSTLIKITTHRELLPEKQLKWLVRLASPMHNDTMTPLSKATHSRSQPRSVSTMNAQSSPNFFVPDQSRASHRTSNIIKQRLRPLAPTWYITFSHPVIKRSGQL